MAIDKRKILNAAQKLVQKGGFEKAIVEYQKVCKADPKDTGVRLKLGDLYLKLGKTDDAIHAYRKVAEQFMADGFDAKAVALFKQITKLDPKCHQVSVPLAELYQRMGLVSDAMAALQTAADAAYQEGDKEDALALLRRMAALEPANTQNRLKVAELLHQEGYSSEAVAEYEEVLGELERQGAEEEHARVLARLVEIDPSRTTSVLELVRAHLDASRFEEAEEAARALVEREPDDTEALEMLGLALDGLGRSQECGEVMREVADRYRQRGDEDRSRDLVQRYGVNAEFSVEDSEDPVLETDDPDETAGLELDADATIGDLGSDGSEFIDPGFVPEGMHIGESLGATAGAAADGAEGKEPESEELELDLDGMDDLDAGARDEEAAPEAPKPAAPVEPAEPDIEAPTPAESAASEPPEDIEQALAEAGVYLRYGKHDRAVAALREILAVEPRHPGALSKLGEALLASDDRDNAATAFTRCAEAATAAGEIALFEEARERLAALDPDAAEALCPPADDDDLGDIDVEIDDGLEDEIAVEDELAADIDVAVDPEIEVSSAEETVVDAAADFDLGEHPTEEPAAGEGIESVAELDIDGIEDEVAIGGGEGEDSGTRGESTTSVRVREELEEAGFYFEQEMYVEAREVYERVLQVAPSHPQAMLRIGEIDAMTDATAPASDPVAAPVGPEASIEPDEPLPTADDFEDSLSGRQDATGDFAFAAQDTASAEDTASAQDTASAEEPAFVDEPAHEEPLEFNFEERHPAAEPDVEPASQGEHDDAGSDAPDPGAGATVATPAREPVSAAEEPAAAATGPVAVVPAPDTTSPMPVPAVATPGAEAPARSDAVPEAASDPAETAPTPIAASDGGEFDLAAQLSDAFDEEAPAGAPSSLHASGGTEEEGFEQVFAAFKQGVQSELGDADHEAHYDLGIAYKEMGLVEDAIGEFEQAMQAPGREVPCLHMMGLCAFELGRLTDAIAHFEQGLSVPEVPQDQQVALRFDLGRAFAQAGDVDRARDAFETVQAIDPEFCDVSTRIDELGSAAPTPAPAVEDDEAFESFDDLIGEAGTDEPVEAAEPAYESFDEFMDDDEDTADADGTAAVAEEVETLAEATPEPVADATPAATAPDGAEATSEMREEAPAAAEPASDPDPDGPEAPAPGRRKRKKISFV